jgi:hypothetical protein
VTAHAQKPDFVFRRNGRVHLNRQGRQFGRLLAAEVWASAVVMLDTLCSEVVWRVLATHFIRQFPLHFPSRASPCAITFQLETTPRIFCIQYWMNRINVDKYCLLLHFPYNILRSSSSIFSRKIAPTSGRVGIACSSLCSPSRGLQFYCALLHVSRTVDAFTECYYVMSRVSMTSRHACYDCAYVLGVS